VGVAESRLRDELERLSPGDDVRAPDWDAVRRGGLRGSARQRLAIAAVLLVIATGVPAFALSASVRGFFGFGNTPRPEYGKAQLRVSAPVGPGQVARLWAAPSTGGGECVVVTVAAPDSRARPNQINGGTACTLGKAVFHGQFWSFSHGTRKTPPVIYGRLLVPGAVGVDLRWRGGSQRLSYSNRFYIGSARSLINPRFTQLPYDIVALDGTGRIVNRARIPTSFLYSDWKQVEPKLHRYRVSHGCDTVNVWHCKSR